MKRLQASFTGGELDPRLHARVDISKYQTGARLLSNWLIHPYGGASNRPGLEFITAALNGAQPVRLAQFDAGGGDTYVIQIASGAMSFIRQGREIIWTAGDNSGSRYTIASPYTGSEVFELSLQQSNDVLTITHPNHPPRTLSRYDNNDWRLVDLSFLETISAPTFISVTPIVRGLVSGEYQWPVDEFYVVTFVDADTGRESLPSEPVSCNIDLSLRGFRVFLEWPLNDGVGNVLRSNVYKRRGGVYGLIGQGTLKDRPGDTPSFSLEDRNISPDMTQGVQSATQPFNEPGQYPKCSTYYQQRRAFAGFAGKKNRTRLSQSSDYDNFNISFPTRESDAIDFSIAQEKRQDIHHMVSGEDLILFTTSGEWRVRGAQEGLLSPASVDARIQSQHGCMPYVPPIVVDGDIVFVQAKGQGVRSMRYDFAQNKYNGEPLNLLALHLFEGRQVKQIAYAAVPFSTIYCVMSDGGCVAFTYLRDQEVFAWSRVETPGEFESVTVVTEGNEDAPYFVIRRNGTRYVERMRSRLIEELQDGFFVDCGLSYDEPVTITGAFPGALDGNLTFLAPGHGLANGDPLEISRVISDHEYDDDGEPVAVGMAGPRIGDVVNGVYEAVFVSGDYFQVVKRGTGEAINVQSWGAYAGGGFVRKAIASVGGLAHLNNRTVYGVADGVPFGPTVVLQGRVDLPAPSARVHVGLPYEAKLETLDLDVGQPVLNGEPRNVQNVVVKVEKTRGLMVGIRFDERVPLFVMRPRDETYQDPLTLWSGQFYARPSGDWNSTGRIVFRASLLPATILAVIPEFDAGGAASERQD